MISFDPEQPDFVPDIDALEQGLRDGRAKVSPILDQLADSVGLGLTIQDREVNKVVRAAEKAVAKGADKAADKLNSVVTPLAIASENPPVEIGIQLRTIREQLGASGFSAVGVPTKDSCACDVWADFPTGVPSHLYYTVPGGQPPYAGWTMRGSFESLYDATQFASDNWGDVVSESDASLSKCPVYTKGAAPVIVPPQETPAPQPEPGFPQEPIPAPAPPARPADLTQDCPVPPVHVYTWTDGDTVIAHIAPPWQRFVQPWVALGAYDSPYDAQQAILSQFGAIEIRVSPDVCAARQSSPGPIALPAPIPPAPPGGGFPLPSPAPIPAPAPPASTGYSAWCAPSIPNMMVLPDADNSPLADPRYRRVVSGVTEAWAWYLGAAQCAGVPAQPMPGGPSPLPGSPSPPPAPAPLPTSAPSPAPSPAPAPAPTPSYPEWPQSPPVIPQTPRSPTVPAPGPPVALPDTGTMPDQPVEPTRPGCRVILPEPERFASRCTMYQQILPRLVYLGQELLAAAPQNGIRGVLASDWLRRLAECLVFDTPALTRQWKTIQKWIDCEAVCTVSQGWLITLSQYVVDDMQRLQALTALRTALQMLAEASASNAMGHSGSVEFSAEGESSGAGEVPIPVLPNLPVSGGVSAKLVGAQSTEDAISASVKPFILPGLKILDDLIRAQCPMQLPSIPDAINLYLRNEVDEGYCKCLIELNGGVWSEWAMVVNAARARLGTLELISLFRRGEITRSQLDNGFRQLGYLHQEDVDRILSLSNEIPPPSDLIRFVVRDALNPPVANKLNLYDEAPEEARDWFRKQGIGWEMGLNIRQDGRPKKADWLDIYWAAHWQSISPGQSYQMMHRIREDTVDDLRAAGFNVDPFKIEDVRQWLKVSDYPPGIRDYLAAISYAVPRLIDIRAGFMMRLRDRKWVIKQLRSRGLAIPDAEFVADLYERQRAELENGNPAAWKRKIDTMQVAEARRAFESGLLTEDEFFSLIPAGAMPDSEKSRYVELVRAKAENQCLASAIRAVRRDYLHGLLSDAALPVELARHGVREPALAKMVRCWRLENGRTKKVATTSQILKWLEKGLLTEAEAAQRLTNLGWTAPDELLMIAETRRKVEETQAKIERAAETARRTAAKELDQLAEKMRRQQKQLQAELKQKSPISVLKKWRKEGYISDSFFRRRASNMGYDQQSIELYLAESGGHSAAVKAESDEIPGITAPPEPAA